MGLKWVKINKTVGIKMAITKIGHKYIKQAGLRNMARRGLEATEGVINSAKNSRLLDEVDRFADLPPHMRPAGYNPIAPTLMDKIKLRLVMGHAVDQQKRHGPYQI